MQGVELAARSLRVFVLIGGCGRKLPWCVVVIVSAPLSLSVTTGTSRAFQRHPRQPVKLNDGFAQDACELLFSHALAKCRPDIICLLNHRHEPMLLFPIYYFMLQRAAEHSE
jgi:hypothetical protein